MHVERHDKKGDKVESPATPPRIKRYGREGGYWLKSMSNGVAGGVNVLRKTQQIDARLGVPIDYEPCGPGAWKACYKDVGQFRKWMRAHQRVSFDPGMGYPCPGDFRGKESS